MTTVPLRDGSGEVRASPPGNRCGEDPPSSAGNPRRTRPYNWCRTGSADRGIRLPAAWVHPVAIQVAVRSARREQRQSLGKERMRPQWGELPAVLAEVRVAAHRVTDESFRTPKGQPAADATQTSTGLNAIRTTDSGPDLNRAQRRSG